MSGFIYRQYTFLQLKRSNKDKKILDFLLNFFTLIHLKKNILMGNLTICG